jgi:hypothetical protein
MKLGFRLHGNDIRLRFAAHDRLDMPRPDLHRRALFVGERMPLIDADNAREAAGDMIEQFFDDRQIDAEPRHAGRDGAPDVVQDPRRNRWH